MNIEVAIKNMRDVTIIILNLFKTFTNHPLKNNALLGANCSWLKYEAELANCYFFRLNSL